jgi:hypothetical protein
MEFHISHPIELGTALAYLINAWIWGRKSDD